MATATLTWNEDQLRAMRTSASITLDAKHKKLARLQRGTPRWEQERSEYALIQSCIDDIADAIDSLI